MTTQETFNALMQGKTVKLTNERFEDLIQPYNEQPTVNEFQIYQIEETVVNLYNEEVGEVFFDFGYDEIFLI